MDRQQIIDTLTTEFGGSLWEKYGKARIYFEGRIVAQRQGLDWANYNTGNISSATLDGAKISNSECRRILEGFAWAKLWFDLNDGKFWSKGIEYRVSTEMWTQFVADAKAAIA